MSQDSSIQPSDETHSSNPNPKPKPKPTPQPDRRSRSRDRLRWRGSTASESPLISGQAAWVGPMSSGLARLLEESDPAATSLDPPTDADLSVPAGERLDPDLNAEDGNADATAGRSA